MIIKDEVNLKSGKENHEEIEAKQNNYVSKKGSKINDTEGTPELKLNILIHILNPT